jgi:hypothetical protein
MASITMSSACVRAVAGRRNFLAGSKKISAAAPVRATSSSRFTVRAEGEVAEEAPKAVAKVRLDHRTRG